MAGKRDLAALVSKAADISFEGADRLVHGVFEIIKDHLACGETVLISGFGRFVVRQKHTRAGRHPQTGERLLLPARRVLTFRASPAPCSSGAWPPARK